MDSQRQAVDGTLRLRSVSVFLGMAVVLSCGLPLSEAGLEDRLMIEIAKQQILSRLGLRERPNITQDMPRLALLEKLRQFKTDLLTLELQDSYDLVNFVDVDVSDWSTTQSSLVFQVTQLNGHDQQVIQASVMVYVRPVASPLPGPRPSVQVFLSGNRGANGTLLAQKQLPTPRGTWQTLPVSSALQAVLDEGKQQLRLDVRCGGVGGGLCVVGGGPGSASRWPFLSVRVRPRRAAALSGRSLQCGEGDTAICCKKEFYIHFRDLQWQDWILAPKGYHINYCQGRCPAHLSGTPGLAASFHAAVFSQLKAHGVHANVPSCCTPISRRPLSIVYLNSTNSVVKTDLSDMIVDSCGCT